ncbi:hypothetical protein V1264_018136 [Littorina saxatilis]|uniref:C2H2-type domain-containing protein n=2 Tax=Littorina saxatilis TaxID=31220 RepID=A0AAN9BCS7_9CAEN
MASPRKKAAKATVFKTEDSPAKLAPLRQSPRKKTMKQNDGLMMLIAAGSVIDQKAKSADTSFEPEAGATTQDEQNMDTTLQSAAAATGDKETPRKTTPKPQKWTKRNLQTVEAITFDMLVKLPTKTLVDLFSERLHTDNQYEDRITFLCKFFEDPAVCSEEFKGYRNEDQVRRRMEEHMVKHRNELIKKGVSSKDFKTTSVQFRVKQEKQAEIKRKKVSSSSASKRNSKFTSIKANSPEDEQAMQEEDQSEQSDIGTKSAKKKASKAKKVKRETPRKQTSKHANKENKPTTTSSTATDSSTPSVQRKKKVKNPSLSETSGSEGAPAESATQDEADELKPYPHCDHDYSTPAGHERKVYEHSGSEDEMADSDDEASISSGVSLDSRASQDLSRGIHLYDAGLTNTPMVCKEETFHESMPEKKVFPSATKSTGRGQLYVPEEENGYLDDELDSKAGIKKQRRPALPRTKNDEIPEWEKRSALKYIRELKQRKKDEKIEYVCKICKEGKKFTAGATLIYHYRSHAGIKPFECSDCGQKFTRQHSKNYHMMIHRNESRFVCKDCGKRFRHPSHYNEHKRKHTGETPYECEDCKMKFKTRNTYKRHLKTRHGKLLTARGIKRMSREEFAKVRTKPYKKSNESSPSHEPMHAQEPAPGPSTILPAVELKPRRIKTSPVSQSSKIPIAPATMTMVQPSPMATVSLPPVSTLLPHFSHSQGGTMVRVNPPPTITAVSHSQPSVGVIPPMGAMRQAGPGMGMLGVTMVDPNGMVASPTGLPQPTQMMVRQAVNMPMGQPAISLPSLQGQAYYTITAYTPIVPMEATPTAYAAQHVQPQVTHASMADDTADYKPVGFITHH